MSGLDDLFDAAEGKKTTSGNADLDSLFDAAEQPSFMAQPGSRIPGVPPADGEPDGEIRVGPPKYPIDPSTLRQGGAGASGSFSPGASGSFAPPAPSPLQEQMASAFELSHKQNTLNARKPPAPPQGFMGNLKKAIFPTEEPTQEQPVILPPSGYSGSSEGEGGILDNPRVERMEVGESNPLETLGDLGGAAVRAAGSTMDPILPWDARGRKADGSRESWLEGLQDPSTGVARPAREALAKQIKQAWENATDEEKPYIERVGQSMLAELGGVGFLAASTVEDPLAVAPVLAATKPARALADAAGRGLQKAGRDQMYRVIKPGIPAERKGFDIGTVFDENIGGSPREVFEGSRQKMNELSAELKRRIQEGADEGHRIDLNDAIDEALADVRDNPGGSADNVAVLDDFDRQVARMKARGRAISRKSGAPDGSLDLLQLQSFKQDLGHRGAWRHIAEKRGIPLSAKESAESRLAEKVYHHLNETIDDLAPSGVRDVNRRLSKLIPLNQAAGHRMVIEGRNNLVSMSDMLSAVATASNPKLWPMFGFTRLAKSGKVANAIYKLGTKLRNATTSAEKARYMAALKKLGLSDEEITAGMKAVEESGGEEAFRRQDLRVKEPEQETGAQRPSNAVAFRRPGDPLPPERRTLPQEEDGDILYQDGANLPAVRSENLPAEMEQKAQPMFYSQLRRTAPEILKKAGGKMKPQDFLNALLKGGTKVKPDEVKWSGLLDYLKERAAGMKPGGDVVDTRITQEMDALTGGAYIDDGRRIPLNPDEIKELHKKVEHLNDKMGAIARENDSELGAHTPLTQERRTRYDALMDARSRLTTELYEGKLVNSEPIPKADRPKDNTPVTAQEIEDYLNENEVQLIENRHGHVSKQERGNIRDETIAIEDEIEKIENRDYSNLSDAERASIKKRLEYLKGKEALVRKRYEAGYNRHEQYNIHKDLGTGTKPADYGEILLSWRRNPKTQRTLGIKSDASYSHSHWNEPDVVVHVRHHTAHTPDGESVLYIDEIQGDWGQQGREQGFRGQKTEDEAQLNKLRADLEKMPESKDEERLALKKQIERLEERTKKSSYGAPVGPFVDATQKWVLLGMKRMIRYAAENGFDRIAWSTGEQQAKRWNFSQVVDKIAYMKQGDKYFITPYRGGRELAPEGLDFRLPKTRAETADILGEAMTRRIDEKVGEGKEMGELNTDDFALGGEGHKAFYNKMVPSAVGKYTEKNWGVKVEDMPVAFKKTKADNPKRRATGTETADGRFSIREIETDPQEHGGDPIEYRLVDNRGNVLDTERSEDRLLDSDEWPKVNDEDNFEVEKRDPEEDDAKYLVEQHDDGRWYIIDNHEPREDVVPRAQQPLFEGERDTRDRGVRYSGNHTYDTDTHTVATKRTEDGFDSEEEANRVLESLREDDGVDQPQYYIVERGGQDFAGPFDSEEEAMSEDNFPQMNDYDAASVEPYYGDPYTEYTVVDENGDQVVDDYFDNEADAIDAMREHAADNPADDAEGSAEMDPNAEHVVTKQQGIKISPAMRKSALEGQELFQKQKGSIKGQIQRKRLGSVITFFKGKADATTWMHEHGHWLRSDVLTPEENKAVLKWAGAATWNRHAEEKFARGLERYLYNGVAPHKNLEKPFATLKEAFRKTYKEARGTEIGQDIPEAMKLVYDAVFLRGQKIRDVAKVQRLLQAARRAGTSSPRIITLLKQELNAPKPQEKEAAYVR